jgi:serine/threonine-protein kinase
MPSVDEMRLLSELLDQALDLPESARTDWLSALTGDAARMAPTLQRLLDRIASRETDDWLSRGPAFTAVGPGAGGATPAFEEGQTVGPYRLVRELGRGGMGEVWLAERTDGQLKRAVALKLPMLGLRRALLVERFARERDILASLVHPNIARLYDAGVSEDGQPFMALEYVQGTTLTAYCDKHHLGTAQRLALFMQVLDAVQYAHTRLVIHRDLKPGNIFVGDDGQVRLLDFGVAKLLAEAGNQGADAAPLTQLGGAAFTPDYASPEQVRGEALGTPSDVYSLGVVLYELLCGHRPYQLRYDSAAQLEQAIVEAEPEAPSNRVETASAQVRNTTLQALRRELRGEIDSIVLTALKKRPEDRYATVAGLAEDLRRHREGEPVLAQPDSWTYRSGKFLRRHNVAASGVLATVLALAVGLGAALWEGRIAQQQRDRALRMVERSNSVNDFMADLLRDAGRGGQGAALQQLLDRGVATVDAGYTKDRELQADLLMMVAMFKASLQGPAAGLPLLDRVQSLLGPSADWNQVVRLRCNRLQADLLTGHIQADQARKTIADTVANPATTADEGANCLYNLSVLEGTHGNHDAAVAAARRALALVERSSISNPKQHAAISGWLAAELVLSGHAQEGLALFKTVDGEFARLHVERSYSAHVLRSNWANISYGTGNPRRALELIERNLAWLHEDRPDEPPPSAFVYLRAAAAAELGRYAQALEGYRDLLDVAQKAHEDRLVFAAHVLTAANQAQLGHLDEAEREYALAAALKSPMLAPGHFGLIGLAQTRAVIDFKQGRLAEALKQATALLADPAAQKPQKQQALVSRSAIELAAGDAATALADAEAGVALGRELQGGQPDSARTGRALLALAKAQHQLSRQEAAQASLLEAARQLSNTVDETQLSLIEVRALLKAMDGKA